MSIHFTDEVQDIHDRHTDKTKAFEEVLQRVRDGQIDANTEVQFQSICDQSIRTYFKDIPDWQQRITRTHPPVPVPVQPHFYELMSHFQSREHHQEIQFFDRLWTRLKTTFEQESQFTLFFSELMKVLHLFYESVITMPEFMEMVVESIRDRELVDELRAVALSRMGARRSQCKLFKPLKDTDFAQSLRVTRSYVKMHQGYAKNESQSLILNQTWVSVPFGSEDYSFQIMRKNTFEEQLFKSEDERYEFDLTLLQLKRTKQVELLQSIIDSEPDKVQKMVKQVLDLKALYIMYRNQNLDHLEIFQYLQTHPVGAARSIIRRVVQKQQELSLLRNSRAKPIWEQISLINFHRSLDHRSFYFKKNDKIFLNTGRFLKEPEERLKVIEQHFGIMRADEVAPKKKPEIGFHYTFEDVGRYVNSLELLTTIKPNLPEQVLLVPPPTEATALTYPLFTLWFGDHDVFVDTVQFLLQQLWVMGGVNQREKRWASKTMVKLVNALFGRAVLPMDLTKMVLSEPNLRSELCILEHQTQNDQFTPLFQEVLKKPSDNPNSGGSSPMPEPNNNEMQQEFGSDASEDEEDGQNWPETLFAQQEAQMLTFQPKCPSIYVNSALYAFLRFFNCVYQRLQIAKSLTATLESNEKTQSTQQKYTEGLTESEKSRIGEQKYMLFKSAFIISLKSREFKYEDYLRVLIGKGGFLFSTLEKLLQDTCKQLISARSTSESLLSYSIQRIGNANSYFKGFITALISNANVIVKESEVVATLMYRVNPWKSEDMQAANLCYTIFESLEKAHERPIFRVSFAADSLYVSMVPVVQKVQEYYELQRSFEFLNKMVAEPVTRQRSARVYLGRNLRRACRPRQYLVDNNQNWIVGEQRAFHGAPKHGNEDLIVEFGRKPGSNVKRLCQQISMINVVNKCLERNRQLQNDLDHTKSMILSLIANSQHQLQQLQNIKETFCKQGPIPEVGSEQCSAYLGIRILHDYRSRKQYRDAVRFKRKLIFEESLESNHSDYIADPEYIEKLKELKKQTILFQTPTKRRYRQPKKQQQLTQLTLQQDLITQDSNFESPFKFVRNTPLRESILDLVVGKLPKDGLIIKWHQLPKIVNQIMAASTCGQDQVTVLEIFRTWVRMHSEQQPFTQADDEELTQLVQIYGENQWALLSKLVRHKTSIQLRERWFKQVCPHIKKKRWAPLEDLKLVILVDSIGAKEWYKLAPYMRNRTDVQLRERWCNVLMPQLERKPWTEEEDQQLQQLVEEHGKAWSLISQNLPGRTDNESRRRWEGLQKV